LYHGGRIHERRVFKLCTDRHAILQISRRHLVFYVFHFFFVAILETNATFILKKDVRYVFIFIINVFLELLLKIFFPFRRSVTILVAVDFDLK
jgi:hypothetical protein